MRPKSERKAFALDVKSIDDNGSFVGLAAVYGNRDLGGDVIDKGAFTKSIQERGTEVPILWQHDQTEPIGKGTLVDTRDGLKINGQLSLGTSRGKEAYELLKDGVVKGLSIGYDVVKQKFTDGARHLQELKLWEVSTVTFPMNEEATVTEVKAADVAKLGLARAQTALVTGVLAKAASLMDKVSAVYDAVQEAFPFANAWVVDVFDDSAIVCTGDRYFSVAITWEDAEGDGELDDPVLGDATEVERTWQPLATSAAAGGGTDGEPKSARHPFERKVGRVISAANHEQLKAAHEHLMKAAKHVKGVMDTAAPAPKKSDTPASGAVPAATEPSDALAHSLREANDRLRRIAGAA